MRSPSASCRRARTSAPASASSASSTANSSERAAADGARAGAALCVAALILAGVSGARLLDGPWEDGFRGINGGGYYGAFALRHLEFGFAATGGANVQHVLRASDPPHFNLNFHHPPAYAWSLAAAGAVFGAEERVFRATALAWFVFALFALRRCVADAAGPLAGGAAALFWAATRAGAEYGPAVSAETATVAAGATALVLLERGVALRSRARVAASAAVFAVACALDWPGYWFGPAAFARLAPRLRDPAARRALGAWVAAALASAALFVLHAKAVGGGFELRDLLGTAASTQRSRIGAAPWSAVVFGHLRALVGDPALIAAGVGLATATHLALRGDAFFRRALPTALALLLPGLLHVLAFRGHAALHDFWFTPGMGGVAACAALLAPAVVRLRLRPAADGRPAGGRRALAVAAAALVVALVAAPARLRELDRLKTSKHRDGAAALAPFFAPEDVILTDADWTVAAYYLKPLLITHVRSAADFDGVVADLVARGARPERFTFIAAEPALDPTLRARLEGWGDAV
ncbi:MAG TPA: hypothetical protein VEI02_06555, partial [Planctomycetota bacterium]|nr:hypothetical protein [Planctomycetota bacterium]